MKKQEKSDLFIAGIEELVGHITDLYEGTADKIDVPPDKAKNKDFVAGFNSAKATFSSRLKMHKEIIKLLLTAAKQESGI